MLKQFNLLSKTGQDIGTVEIDTLQILFGDETDWSVKNPSWNPSRRLIAFELQSQLEQGSSIAYCDLDGNKFGIAPGTPGTFYNRWPRWGPNGQILFIRSGLDDFWSEKGTLMSFDIDNNQLRVFLSPSMIEGAQGITFFDYVE